MFTRGGRTLVGMVHVGALPGTPRSALEVVAIAEQAAREAAMLADAGFDAILIENMHDVPYLRRAVGPESVAGMTATDLGVRSATALPVGIQIDPDGKRAYVANTSADCVTVIDLERWVATKRIATGRQPDGMAWARLAPQAVLRAEAAHAKDR